MSAPVYYTVWQVFIHPLHGVVWMKAFSGLDIRWALSFSNDAKLAGNHTCITLMDHYPTIAAHLAHRL